MTVKHGLAAFSLAALAGSAGAQDLISVNLWSIGKPSSPSPWADDPSAIDTLQLDGSVSAGAPGYETMLWQNLDLGNPFSSSTGLTAITGSNSASADFQIYNRRGNAPYNWTGSTRDTSDELPANAGNAILLDGKAHATEFDAANGSGDPFGKMIFDADITNIPFTEYSVVVYLSNQSGQQSGDRDGIIRVNTEIDRPSDLTNYRATIPGGGLNMTGGTRFLLPPTAQGYEPDGVLDEVTADGDTGNYIVFDGLTDSTFSFQVWGENFNHLGVSGFQVLESSNPAIPGDTDGDGDIDDADLGTSFANYTGPLAPGTGGKTAAEGDTDGDGDVDDADLGTSFSGYTGPLTASVPEPTTLALLGLGGLALARRRRS